LWIYPSASLFISTDAELPAETLVIHNHGSSAETVKIVDAYSGKTTTHHLPADSAVTFFAQLEKSFGWYDFTLQADSDATFQRRLAGHLETGRDSKTDPAIGTATA
jgi:phospholipase C